MRSSHWIQKASLTHLVSHRGCRFFIACSLTSAVMITVLLWGPRLSPPFCAVIKRQILLKLHTSWQYIKNRIAGNRQSVSPAADGTARNNNNAYPTFPPPSPEELLSRPTYYNLILNEREFLAPRDTPADTPLFALYRLYEHLVLNRTTGLRNELERFWFNRCWPVSSIPDPQDHSDPARYAVLACIPALMTLSFNKRIDLGIPRRADAIMTLEEIESYRDEERVYESVPEWTLNVRPLEIVLKIPHEGGETLESFDDKRASRQLMEKNILCWQPHIHFV